MSAGQETHALPDPFFVLATQNPIEQEGTYPLPEAQLDRFMFTIKVDYPTFEEEKQILASTGKGETKELAKVLSGTGIRNIQNYILGKVVVGDSMLDYITRLVRATRPRDPSAPEFVRKMVDYGGGPRAGLFLRDGAKAFAFMNGRIDVTFEDIKKVAVPVLRHRIATNFQAQAEGKTSEDIIAQLLATITERDAPKYQKSR